MSRPAYISELAGQGGGGEGNSGEYVEITVLVSENLSNYTVSFYNQAGLLEPGGGTSSFASPGSSFFPGQPEITLQEIFTATGGIGSVSSSIGGLSLQVSVHPTEADYLVFTIPSTLSVSAGGSTAEIVTLYNTQNDELIDAFRIGSGVVTLQDGVAAGGTTIGTGTGVDGAGGGADSKFNDTGAVVTGGGRTPGNSVITDPLTPAICFSAECQIEAAHGLCKINTLKSGDLIVTKDHGLQTIRWIGSRRIDAVELEANPKLRPVRITAGALGCGLPKRDLVVSRQHRMLVNSHIANRMFGASEVLVAAAFLTALPGIYVVEDATSVEYVHILFDRHEVIFAEGAPSESLHTGPEALKTLSQAAIAEIFTIFPDLNTGAIERGSAYLIPQRSQQKRLIISHAKSSRVPITKETWIDR